MFISVAPAHLWGVILLTVSELLQQLTRLMNGWQVHTGNSHQTTSKTTTNKTITNKTPINKTTINKTTINKTTINKTTINKTTNNKTTNNKTTTNKTTTNKTTTKKPHSRFKSRKPLFYSDGSENKQLWKGMIGGNIQYMRD